MQNGSGLPNVLFTCFTLILWLGSLGFFIWWALQVAKSLRDITSELRGLRQAIDRGSMKDPGSGV